MCSDLVLARRRLLHLDLRPFTGLCYPPGTPIVTGLVTPDGSHGRLL